MTNNTDPPCLAVNTGVLDIEYQQAIASGKSFHEVKEIYLRVKRVHALFNSSRTDKYTHLFFAGATLQNVNRVIIHPDSSK